MQTAGCPLGHFAERNSLIWYPSINFLGYFRCSLAGQFFRKQKSQWSERTFFS